MQPLVSIIVPVYKVEKYLPLCLDSILSQTYKNLEVILVDDGSPDDCPKICEDYATKDTRVRVIHQENKGLASARNTGLRNMTGDFFYFVDSDDCIHPSLIEMAVKEAEQENANLVQIELETVPSDFSEYKKEIPVYRKQIFDRVQSLYNLDQDDQSRGKDIRLTTTVVWTKLYRTAAFRNFMFPEGMRMHEDQMVAHRLIQTAGGMVFLDAPLYYYRMSEVSLIRVGWTPKRLAILDCYEDRLAAVKEIPENNQALIDFIYYRYLVCIFRNYDMADQKLSGEEKKQTKKEILARMKKVFQEKEGQLSMKQAVFFRFFMLFPDVVTKTFQIRNRMK